MSKSRAPRHVLVLALPGLLGVVAFSSVVANAASENGARHYGRDVDQSAHHSSEFARADFSASDDPVNDKTDDAKRDADDASGAVESGEESGSNFPKIIAACIGVLFGGAIAAWQIKAMKKR